MIMKYLDEAQKAQLREREAISAASEWLSIERLAMELGISVRTIRRWHKAGDAPPRRRKGRKLVYYRRDVEKWLCKKTPSENLTNGEI